MRHIWSIFILIAFSLGTLFVVAESTTDDIHDLKIPILVKLNISKTPLLNESAYLNCEISSVLDAPNTTATIILPEGVILMDGNLSGKWDLKANVQAYLNVSLKFTHSAEFKIEAIARRVIDSESAWEDTDVIYLKIESNKSFFTPGFKYMNQLVQVLPGTGQQIPSDITRFPIYGSENLSLNFSSQEIQGNQFNNSNNANSPYSNNTLKVNNPGGALILTGKIGYYTKLSDYRNTDETRVPAEFFAVVALDGNNKELSRGYTGEDGSFMLFLNNPGLIGVRVRLYASGAYVDEIARVVYQGSSLSGFTDVYWWQTPTYVFYGDNEDIGTFDVQRGDSNEGACWILSDVIRASRLLDPIQGIGIPGSCTISWTPMSTEVDHYSPGGQIYLAGVTSKSSDATIRQYGNFVLYNSMYGVPVPSYCPNPYNFLNKLSHQNCAWENGWATFLALAANGNPIYTRPDGSEINLEAPTWGTPDWDNGDAVEGRVAGALWDIFDTNNDGADLFSYGIGAISNIVLYENYGWGLDGFWCKWISDGYPQDAINCIYQNTIDYRPSNTPVRPSGPTSGTPGTTYTYSSSAISPGGSQVRITFDWGDGETSTTDWVNSGTIASASHKWSKTGKYSVKAKAAGFCSGSSSWSELFTVNIMTPVILLHGWRGDGKMWSKLAEKLKLEGFVRDKTLFFCNFTETTKKPFPRYTNHLTDIITQIRATGYEGKIDIVAHSMGGLIARWYIEKQGGASNINQLIMLCTPNHGASIASLTWLRFWDEAAWSLTITSEYLSMLNYDENQFNLIKWKSVPEPGVIKANQSGVIYRNIVGAGEYTWVHKKDNKGELYDYWTEQGDGVVPLYLTQLEGVGLDYFPGTHTDVYLNDAILERVIGYLNNKYTVPLDNYPKEDKRDKHTVKGTGKRDIIYTGIAHLIKFPIDSSSKEAEILTNWAGSDLDLTLTSPSGIVMMPGILPVVDYSKANNSIWYVIDLPEPGIWTARIDAIDVPENGEPYTFLTFYTSNLTLDVATDDGKYSYSAGESTSIIAALTHDDIEITGALVRAEVTLPDDSKNVLILYDDGIHGDSKANDGNYTNVYHLSIPGIYEFVVYANNSINEAFERCEFLTLEVVDESPNIMWQRCFGGSGYDLAYRVQKTNDGGYILAGLTESTNGNVSGNHGNSDFWVVKIDGSGKIQWQKCLGGGGEERAFDIQQTNEGGYIVVGYSVSNDGNVSGNHGGSDIWVVKLDNAGNVQWQKCLGGTASEEAYSVQQTNDDGYIIAGSANSNNGDVSGYRGAQDFWIVKLSNTGTIKWQKCLGGSDTEEARSVRQTNDGGYIVAGSTWSKDGDVSGNHGGLDFWVVKLDSVGLIQWQKCLGGSGDDKAYDIQLTDDGGYIVAGNSKSNNGDVSGNHGGSDFWVAKLDSVGLIQWQKCLGGTGDDAAGSVQQTDGGYIVTGYSNSNNGDITDNHGYYDFWLVKIDEIGQIIWQKCFGGSDYDQAASIELTRDRGYIVAGYSYSNDGDVSGNHGYYDYWLIKLEGFLNNPNPPNSPYMPVGPASGSAKASYSYTTAATDPDGDQVKYTFDWGDGTTSETSLVNSGTVASASHTWSTAGTYQVKAMATDSKGATSGYSSSLTVTISPNKSPNAPGKPSGSAKCVAGSSYSYSTSASDPDKDNVKYTFDWGDGTKSETGLVKSGIKSSATHAWSSAGTYLVKANATDSKGATSGYSSSLTITVNPNKPPTAPGKPSGSATCVAGSSYSYSTSASDPDKDKVKYTFDWGDGTKSDTVLVNSGIKSSTTHAWSTPGTYLVKANATDFKGAASGYSGSLSVTISPNSIPGTPSVPTGTVTGKIKKSYSYTTSVTDPDGDKLKYTFDWGDGKTSVTSFVNSGTSASSSHAWSKAGTFQVKVMTTDSKGAPSISWSSQLAVTIT